jgi:anaerobic C4-dicarboxylate transporter
MIADFIVFLASQIPGIIVGALAGGILVFFYIQHKLKSDPNWVENLYQKQRALSMQGTEAIAKENADLKAQIEGFKAKETINTIADAVIAKLKSKE